MSNHDDTHDTGEHSQGDHPAGEPHGPPSVSPVWSKRILTAFWAGCAVLLVLDFFVTRKVEHRWEQLPGFYAIFGFLGVCLLIVLSKELRKGVGRSEDYYDG